VRRDVFRETDVKLGRIEVQGEDGPVARLVLVLPDEGRIVDLRRAAIAAQKKSNATHEAALRYAGALFPGSMSAAIALGDRFIEGCRELASAPDDAASLPIDGVTWLPATDPSVVRDGLTFIEHIKGFHEKMGATPVPSLLQVPGYFKGTPWTLYGQDAEIRWPSFVTYMDYELELGWVIGRGGRDLTPDTARDHIFGVTIFNDFSARDRQHVEMPIGMGPQKCKDFAYGIGPWITTIDEFKELRDFRMEIRVNGEVWSSGLSGETLWSPEELVAYVSLGDWLQPGDIIGSGTFGKGSALELGRQLSPGDVVELHVDGIGTLRNRMAPAPEPAGWWPTERAPFM
jgi:2-keto-4-pentenoate hydratase/2-oxohepta-3-ene-1,7-dioic acid hydratase in catechol pathway